MNTLPANEVKRRGVAALVESLKKGPVHIIKNNRPVCVVLSEEDYQTVLGQAPARMEPSESLLESMIRKPVTGSRTRKEIDAWLRNERNSWDKA